MTGAHLRIVNDSELGRTCRVFVNGVDITSATRDVQIAIPLRGATTATIEIIVGKLELDTDALVALRPYSIEPANG